MHRHGGIFNQTIQHLGEEDLYKVDRRNMIRRDECPLFDFSSIYLRKYW